MLSVCYSQYLKFMAALDLSVEQVHHGATQQAASSVHELSPEFDFESADAQASRLGNRYRGIGVSVGLLSIIIIFAAVAPPALQLAGSLELVLGLVKIISMTIMLALVLYGARTGLRRRWIIARRKAESLRYQALAYHIQHLKATLDEQAPKASRLLAAQKLKEQIRKHLGRGTEHCQIGYNRTKARQYIAAERMGDRLGWVGFALALGAAVAHLFWHANWMLLLTVFVPALIGAIHGINGFLKLEDLAEGHLAMASRLSQVADELERVATDEVPRLVALAELTYQLLTDRDVQWAETANRLGLKIA